MKVIFLDIDGVLTSVRTGWYNMDIYAVNFIRWVCKVAGAKIVISGTWRYNHGYDFWKPIFEEHLHHDFKTPDSDRGKVYANEKATRGNEIQAWLNKHPEVIQYIILDDDSDMLEHQMPYLIQTDSMNGILDIHMMELRDKFDIKTYPDEEEKLHQHKNMFAVNNRIHKGTGKLRKTFIKPTFTQMQKE